MADDLMAQLEQFKTDYYSTNSKNTFFKKSQKKDMAQQVSNTFNLEDLIKRTVFVIPDTHHMIFDYSVFKHYAHEETYHDIIRYSLELIGQIVNNHGKFVIHANIGSLTITSIERHRKLLEMVNQVYLSSENGFSEYFLELYMYYPPSMIDSIFTFIRPFLDASIMNKMNVVSKSDSDKVYPQLIESLHK
jgi:hypothetical protein